LAIDRDHNQFAVEGAEIAMLAYVRFVILLIGVIGVFGLFAAGPFFPPEWKELPGALALAVFAAALGLILVINKIFCGVYFPGRPVARQQRATALETVSKDLPAVQTWALFFLGVGVPTVFVAKQFGLSKHEQYIAALIVPLVMAALFNLYIRYRSRRS
jgi:hypothetical protein